MVPEEVANARREADKDPLKKQLANVAKLKENSFYGKMIEDLGRHKSTKFTLQERVVDIVLMSPLLTVYKRSRGLMRSKSLSEP